MVKRGKDGLSGGNLFVLPRSPYGYLQASCRYIRIETFGFMMQSVVSGQWSVVSRKAIFKISDCFGISHPVFLSDIVPQKEKTCNLVGPDRYTATRPTASCWRPANPAIEIGTSSVCRIPAKPWERAF